MVAITNGDTKKKLNYLNALNDHKYLNDKR